MKKERNICGSSSFVSKIFLLCTVDDLYVTVTKQHYRLKDLLYGPKRISTCNSSFEGTISLFTSAYALENCVETRLYDETTIAFGRNIYLSLL